MKPRLKTLKPRVQMVGDRIPGLSAATNPMVAQRLRGRAGVERRARWLYLHPLCKHCEEQTPPRVTIGKVVDHVIPLWKGGPDDDSNLQTLCDEHAKEKTAREAADCSTLWG